MQIDICILEQNRNIIKDYSQAQFTMSLFQDFSQNPDMAKALHIGQMTSEHIVVVIHANDIEHFWSLIKRRVVGTCHEVSRKYLPLYVAEFQFR